MSLNSSELQ
ncbi:Protein of unknown function [Bacillus mycoides]|nr:Protein of unknown function [Bacillus mycoides]